MNPYVKLARKALKKWVKDHKVLKVKDNSSELFSKKRGVFVTLKKEGKLRGCMGTFLPTKKNLAEEIASVAASSAQDPRFPPVMENELSELNIEIYILEKPERVESLSELDPGKYGLLVKKDGKIGILLPGLSTIKTPAKQFKAACRKAGIVDLEDTSLFRFEAQKFTDFS